MKVGVFFASHNFGVEIKDNGKSYDYDLSYDLIHGNKEIPKEHLPIIIEKLYEGLKYRKEIMIDKVLKNYININKPLHIVKIEEIPVDDELCDENELYETELQDVSYYVIYDELNNKIVIKRENKIIKEVDVEYEKKSLIPFLFKFVKSGIISFNGDSIRINLQYFSQDRGITASNGIGRYFDVYCFIIGVLDGKLGKINRKMRYRCKKILEICESVFSFYNIIEMLSNILLEETT